MLNHDWIAAHIPHQGNMCLLDSVLTWSHQRIECLAHSHVAADNPLRSAGRLGAVIGVEYAAQAMAVHGAMVAPADGPPCQGYLTSVRGLTLHVDRLDDPLGPLLISAERLSGDERLVMYQFSIHHQARCLVDGRATVVLDAKTL